MTYKVSNN